MCQNYVISWDLTLFWQILFEKCFLKMFPFLGRKLSDNCQSSFSDRLLTDFYIRHWLFSDTIMLSDTFQRHFQNWSDIFLMELCNWQISDRYLTVFWQFTDSFLQLTYFWQFYDRFLTDFWNCRDPHKLRVPIFGTTSKTSSNHLDFICIII